MSYYTSMETRIIHDRDEYFVATVYRDSYGEVHAWSKLVTLGGWLDVTDLHSDIAHAYDAISKPVLRIAEGKLVEEVRDTTQ